MKKYLQRAVILPIIVLCALIFVVVQVKFRAPLAHKDLQFPVKAVEVITVQRLPFRARAVAYGNVEPKILLNLKSEVSGKISYIHPALQKGGSLAKDTIALRVEPTIFEFSLDQSKAGLAGSKSSLTQLKTEEKSTRRSLQIAKKNLQVGKKELKRIKAIWDKRLIARSSVDAEEQKVLQLRQQVEDLQGKLAAYSSRKAATKAQIKQSKTQVEQTQDTLGRTEIYLPFDARIGTVSVEKGEFISAGSQLFEALGLQAVEITAYLPIHQFRPLVMSALGHRQINLQDPTHLQTTLSGMQLEARVSLVGNSAKNSYWQGTLVRLSESIDPTRDTIGLVIEVDKPYEQVIPGIKPPLLKGMYTAVELLAPAKPALVVPRNAVHQGRVYIATAENTLTIRTVDILYSQGALLVIAGGLEEGEQLIISDVIPVIEGMPLKLIAATETEKQIALMALRGRGENRPAKGAGQ